MVFIANYDFEPERNLRGVFRNTSTTKLLHQLRKCIKKNRQHQVRCVIDGNDGNVEVCKYLRSLGYKCTWNINEYDRHIFKNGFNYRKFGTETIFDIDLNDRSE